MRGSDQACVSLMYMCGATQLRKRQFQRFLHRLQNPESRQTETSNPHPYDAESSTSLVFRVFVIFQRDFEIKKTSRTIHGPDARERARERQRERERERSLANSPSRSEATFYACSTKASEKQRSIIMTKDTKQKVAKPVAAAASGTGLPYAPENWPNEGDVWRWKVGSRKAPGGYWLDRYLSPPERLQKAHGRRVHLASKVSVKEYLVKQFPNADVDAFFDSFSWKVPYATRTPRAKGPKESNYSRDIQPVQNETNEHVGLGPDLALEGVVCKAGNRMCSLQAQETSNSLEAMECNICCSEPGFCRECCCILCCKTISYEYGGYSFIKCEARVDGNYICGHIAHVNCALRCFMAGTIGGSIGLDAEYNCRRCDNITDLIPHVSRLVEICQSIDSKADIEKILNLGFHILLGSQQTNARDMLDRVQLMLKKIKSDIDIKDLDKVGNDVQVLCSVLGAGGQTSHLDNGTKLSSPLDFLNGRNDLDLTTRFEPPHEVEIPHEREAQAPFHEADHQIAPSKLEKEISDALESLKRSQDLEYRIVAQKLYAQKDLLLRLQEQLDADISKLAEHTTSPASIDSGGQVANGSSRVDQITNELVKLRQMMEIAKGFGRTPRAILREHFGLQIED
ncbi:hypothetical protein ACLOJK_032711 [Asimina triloba]